MANYQFGVTLLDDNGKPGQTSGYFVAADDAGAEDYIQGIVEAMNNPAPAGGGALPLTLGVVASVTMTRALDFSAWTLTPAAISGAENQVGGRFVFKSQFGKAQMTVPTFNPALFDIGRNVLIANPAVVAFYNTGILSAGGADNHYDDLTALLEAYKTLGGKDARR